jgi:glycosyltransferase involved in cell wall biosynthesis
MELYHPFVIDYDIDVNVIRVRLADPGPRIIRKVQIFSPEKEFPFLFAGSLELSHEYNTLIYPQNTDNFYDWKRGGFKIRFLTDTDIEKEFLIDTTVHKTKVLFITPHLSTGGCPQYLYKKIQLYKDVLDIYVVEYSFISPTYIVQRSGIIDIVKDHRFFSLGENKRELLTIIDKVQPEIIHFEEMPENFVDFSIAEEIYTKKDRKYFMTETTHSSFSDPKDKRFLPDKFIFCSRYSQEKFKVLEIPSEIWEYPIENLTKRPRKSCLEKLGLDPNSIHVLNVGLFTKGKNQGEIFEIAKKFIDEKVVFHFIGNQAPNFEDYWKPLMDNKPENCKVWGERADVADFMEACDIFYFSSILELNPLAIKEALSWKMPVLMKNLKTYMGTYDNQERVYFIDNDIEKSEKILRNVIVNLPQKPKSLFKTRKAKLVHILSELDSTIEQASIQSVSKLANENLEYTIHYNPPASEIPEDRDPLFSKDEIGKNLKEGHFGCFEAFRKAITEVSDNYDFLIVCERDCLLEKDTREIHELLYKTYLLMEREEILYFSFGDKVDLDKGVLQSEKVQDLPGGFSFITSKIIGLQFVIFSRKGIEFLKHQFKERGWYGMDIWLNVVFNENSKKMGILNERVTTQIEGFSLIDNVEKKFVANEKKR